SLGEGSSRRKFQAAETAMRMSNALDKEPLAKACELLQKRLNLALDGEREAPVYAKLVELAALLLDSRFQKRGPGGAADLVETLKRHSAAADPAFPERSGLARSMLSKFLPATEPAKAPAPTGSAAADRVAAALHSASI